MKMTLTHDETFPAALESQEEWDDLTDRQRAVASKRLPIVKYLMGKVDLGVSVTAAVEHFLLSVTENRSSHHLSGLVYSLGRRGKPVNRSTLLRWCAAYKTRGFVGLAPGYKARQLPTCEWHVRVIYYLQKPSKLSVAEIARILQEEGHADASENRVRRYIKSVPSDVQLHGRIGKRLFDNTQKTFVRRTMKEIPVGTCYQGDGHTIDVYLQHPSGNRPWRAEMTLWLDVTSRYVVGWWISEAESAHSTLFALSHALLSQDHIPAVLHVDNGSGYKNKVMSDRATGIYARLGISVMHSRPYNAKGKGHIERFFGTMERSFGKRFDSYCGADMDPEALNLLLKKHKNGKASLPTKAQFIDLFTQWLTLYHNRPHRGLDGKTPAELWATLERHPVEPKSAAIFWPRRKCTVTRQSVTLNKRSYEAPELLHFNKTPLRDGKVLAEYNIHDDSFVRVLTMDGAWICDARLIKRAPGLTSSYIDDSTKLRADNAEKRLLAHAEEKRRRASLCVTGDEATNVLDSMNNIVTIEPGRKTVLREGSVFEDSGLDPFGSIPEVEPAKSGISDDSLFCGPDER